MVSDWWEILDDKFYCNRYKHFNGCINERAIGNACMDLSIHWPLFPRQGSSLSANELRRLPKTAELNLWGLFQRHFWFVNINTHSRILSVDKQKARSHRLFMGILAVENSIRFNIMFGSCLSSDAEWLKRRWSTLCFSVDHRCGLCGYGKVVIDTAATSKALLNKV